MSDILDFLTPSDAEKDGDTAVPEADAPVASKVIDEPSPFEMDAIPAPAKKRGRPRRTSEPQPEETSETSSFQTPREPSLDEKIAEERGYRERLTQELEATRARLETVSKRAEMLASKFKEEEEPEVPDLASDPVGNLSHEIRTLKEELAALKKEKEEQGRLAEGTKYEETLIRQAQTHAQRFAEKTPDFTDAIDFLSKGREQELRIIGVPEDQLVDAIKADLLAITEQAIYSKKDVGELLYNMAKLRGYTGTRRETPERSSRPLSLSGAPGAGMPASSDKDILEMNDSEFENFFKRVKRSGR